MKRDIRILTEEELRDAVTIDGPTIDIVETAFTALAGGRVVMPPILSMEIAESHGEVDVKTAYIPGLDSFAIKISPGFFDNPKLGLPSTNGLMVLFSAKTGMVEAVLLDNGYLTDVRTAAAGAVAARHLAPKAVERAGVMGTGAQARLQMIAAHQVRPFKHLQVWGRDFAKAKTCADDLRQALGIDVVATESAEELVRGCQLVVTTTPSREPIIQADWLHENLHITAMGSDQDGKNEIDPRALARADLYVCDRVSQCEKLGELRSAMAAGVWNKGSPPELGEIIAGTSPGRSDDGQITICDLTGTGAQDTVIATYVYGRLGGGG